MLKFDGSGRVDFGRWKTKMLAIAAIKGEFNRAYLTQLPLTAAPNATPPVTADDVLENIKKNQLAWNYLFVALEGPPLEAVLNLTTNDPFNA